MPPAAWLTSHADLLPAAGDALDVASGRGRHALWLAARGWRVTALDRSPEAIAELGEEARRRGLAVTAVTRDLESGDADLGRDRYDLIVVVHYLHRPLFPALLDALRPGGLLVYETFTRRQADRGKPTNPAFLLDDGELRQLVAPLEVLAYREGAFDDRDVASVVGRKPADSRP